MKNIKAPKVEPVTESIKLKKFKPSKVVATITRTKAKTWELSYTVGKETYKLDKTFDKLEKALAFLNCEGKMDLLDEKGSPIALTI